MFVTTNKNKRRPIWIYAIILFTIAFILLLMTAYSQVKFNKNIDEYKTRISSEEQQKNNYQTNLNNALEENKRFKVDLESLKGEITKDKAHDESIDKELTLLNEKYTQTISAYETLSVAEGEYSKGNYIECATLLYREFNTEFLGITAKERYSFLVNNSFEKAAKLLYIDGFKQYNNKNYESAIKSLNLSKDLAAREYYSDDCYYYIAYSEYRLGRIDIAGEILKTLLNKYPDSNYKADAVELLKEMQK